MLLQLFLTFVKINFLTTSGPASYGLTEKLVVPNMISKEVYLRLMSIASGVPGSDAIQMAWQIGFQVAGIPGALISVLGALLPCIVLASAVTFGLTLLSPDILSRFFGGVKPILVVLLITTAVTIIPLGKYDVRAVVILLLGLLAFKLNVPVLVVLLASGFIGLIK